MVLLADIVATSGAVAATRSRKAKTQALAELLAAAPDPGELALVVGFLIGEPRQGRLGIGWRTLAGLGVPPADAPSLPLAEVDAALDRLTATTGPRSVQRRAAELRGLFAAATEDEQRFLVQLLTGELRQGALDGVMVEAVALAAGVPADAVRRAFMLSGRLPATAAAALRGGVEELAGFRLQLGRPVRPMLASPAETLDTALADLRPASVEYKLDGARIQVHRDGDEVHVYTRTLREVTAKVPELVGLARSLPCRSVVLDGETLALTDDGRPRPFQETMSRFGAARTRERFFGADARTRERFFGAESLHELLLRPWFFDCLHLDGADLLDAPLAERLAALQRVAGEHRIPYLLDPDADAAAELLDAALAAGHEGVMVKSLAAPYAAGRRGKAWQKVKPVHTLDLVVLAAEWGYGRRTGWLSNLHLGARAPTEDHRSWSVRRSRGSSDELLTWQTAELAAREIRREGHVVHVRPELVVEIELDGVQSSPRYPGGVALRFARVLRYRPDKDPADADTIDAVRAIGQQPGLRAGRGEGQPG